MLNFNNKVVLITGGSRGIGAACVRLFADAGADVAFSYSANEKAADELVKSISTKGKIKALQDLAIRVDVDELTDFVNLLILGIDTTETNFANFLKENEIRLQEIKESKALEKQASKPIYAILLNVLSFAAIISVLIMPMLLSFIDYLNKF